MILPASLKRRLLQWVLWWRHSYTFNFAHKPLCSRFQSDVFRFGKMSICRSCTILYASMLATIVSIVALRSQLMAIPPFALIGTVAAAVTITAFLSYPPTYKRLHRSLRDVVRAVGGCVIAACPALALLGHPVAAVTLCLSLAVAIRLCFRARARMKERMCDGCPELAEGGVCSGFREQARHVREFEEQVTEAWMRGGYVPDLSRRDVR